MGAPYMSCSSTYNRQLLSTRHPLLAALTSPPAPPMYCARSTGSPSARSRVTGGTSTACTLRLSPSQPSTSLRTWTASRSRATPSLSYADHCQRHQHPLGRRTWMGPASGGQQMRCAGPVGRLLTIIVVQREHVAIPGVVAAHVVPPAQLFCAH